MPTLLSTSITEILAQLPIADHVQLALIKRSGTLGNMLELIEITEEGGKIGEEILCELPGIDVRFLNSCLTQALSWANNLDRERS
jgi:c-di-GMP-related signal transduction protein